MKPKVSIITPVYNTQEYIENCINSILNQTFKDFELILVNDGSTDNSLEICKKYEKIDSRIVIVDQINEGVAAARNTGLKKAQGEYIAWVDSDDWIGKEYIENLYYASISNANIPVIVIKDKRYVKKNEIIEGKKIILDFLDGMIPSSMWSTLFQRKLYKDLQFKKYCIGEDAIMLIDLFRRVNRICCIYSDDYHYVNNPNSITRLKTQSSIMSCIAEVNDQRIQVIRNYPYAKSKMNYKAMMFSVGLLNEYKDITIIDEAKKLLKSSYSEILIFDLSAHQIKEYLVTLIKNWKEIKH